MLFTTPDNGNMNEYSREYLYSCHQIELKKLHRKLAEEEEVEHREAIRAQRARGATMGSVAANLVEEVHVANQADLANDGHEVHNSEHGNEDEEGDWINDKLDQTQLQLELWNS
jgi:hypothetical protein